MPMQVNYSKGTANGAVIKRIIGGEKEPVFNFARCNYSDQETTDYIVKHLDSNIVVPSTANTSNSYDSGLLYQLFKNCKAKELVINRIINITPEVDTMKFIKTNEAFMNSDIEIIKGTGGFRSSIPFNFEELFSNAKKLKSVDMNVFLGTDNGGANSSCKSMFMWCTSLEEILNLDLENLGYSTGYTTGMFGNTQSNAPNIKRITFRAGTQIAKYSTSDITIDFYYFKNLTREALREALSTLSENTTGKLRKFQITANLYNTLSEDDIALFTAKNYTLVSK